MKKAVVLLSMGMLAIMAGADTVNFTTGEGYTTPGALTDYAGWNGNASFIVNTNGTGTVEWGNTASAQVNYETATLASALTIETSVQFRMKQATGYTSGSKMAAGIALNPNSTDSSQVFNDVRAYVNRTSATTYQLVLQNSTTGTFLPRILGGGFNESGLGLDGLVGDDSDLLEIKLVLNRGATETNWTANAILKNVTTGTTAYQILDYAIETPFSYFEAPLYGSILAGTTDAILGMTRQIESFSISGDQVAIDFTKDEGYTIPQNLTDYPGWNGNTEFTVNTNGTGTVDWGGTSSIAMNYETGIPVSALTTESSIQFRFTRVAGYTGGAKVLTGIFFEKDAIGTTTAGLDDTRTFLQRNGADTYQMKFLNATDGTVSDETTGSVFNQSLLGITGNDDVSDLLEIKFILHRGATENDWTADTILRNVTTDTSVYQLLGRAFSSTTDYFDSTLYGSISGGTKDVGSGYIDRQIESFSLLGTLTLPPPVFGYDGWAGGWGVGIGSETNDYDEDGFNNLYEYGLGGDPTNEFDQGTSPAFGIVEVGGTNWFGYVHPQLSDVNSGLSYFLELNTDLVLGTWTNAGYAVLGTNVTGNALDFVTNVTGTVDGQKFIRLIIE